MAFVWVRLDVSCLICVSAPTEHPKESKYRPVLEVFPFTNTPNPFTPSLWKVPYSCLFADEKKKRVLPGSCIVQ